MQSRSRIIKADEERAKGKFSNAFFREPKYLPKKWRRNEKKNSGGEKKLTEIPAQ